jgi:UDPglucose 6-dehydrogenase
LKLKKMLGGSLKGKQVGVWGLAFKPYTDDIRDSPAIVVVQDLLAEGAMVRVHDPKATENFLKLFPDAGGSLLAGFDNHYDAARDADGVVLVTEWREYRMPDFMHLKSLAPNVSVVDARNVWREEDARAAGIPYARIGRASK